MDMTLKDYMYGTVTCGSFLNNPISEAVSSRRNTVYQLKKSDNVRDWIDALRMYGLKIVSTSDTFKSPEEGIVYVIEYSSGDMSIRFAIGPSAFKVGFDTTRNLELDHIYINRGDYTKTSVRWIYVQDDAGLDMVNRVLNGETTNEAVSSKRNYADVDLDMTPEEFIEILELNGLDKVDEVYQTMGYLMEKDTPSFFYQEDLYRIFVTLPDDSECWGFEFQRLRNLFAPDKKLTVSHIDRYDFKYRRFKQVDSSDTVLERKKSERLIGMFNDRIER